MIARILLAVPFLFTLQAYAHERRSRRCAKGFDGYQKVKDARERLDKSKKIAMEELEIFRDELEKIVKELKEMEEKLKNPNIESSSLKAQYQKRSRKPKRSKMIWLLMIRERKRLLPNAKESLVEHLEDIREQSIRSLSPKAWTWL